MEIEFEITKGYYLKQELENYIQNIISKNFNTPTTSNRYSSTEGKISIQLQNIVSSVGNLKELKLEKEI